MNENNKAIDMLVDKIVSVTESKTQNLKYDKTFQSTVWKVNPNGTYGINYLGQIYNVKNTSGFALTKGQKVWVKIPSGIFRNMIITGVSGENFTGSVENAVTSVNGHTGNVILTKSDIGLSDVPNVTTNEQRPTFTIATERSDISSTETLSVLFGKIKRWFADLKPIAFTASYNDLKNQPTIPTKTSELKNDSNYVLDSNYIHTDNNYTTTEKEKLNGIDKGANKYELPIASDTLGGVKTTSTVTSNAGYTPCPIISGVPYYKDTVYTHPTTAGNKHIPSGGSSGQVLTWSSSGTATWADPSGGDSSNSKIRYVGGTTDRVQLLGDDGVWYNWKFGGLNVTYLYNEGEFNTDIISGFINGSDGSSDVTDKNYITETNGISTGVTGNNTSTTILTGTMIDIINYSKLGATIYEGGTERNIEVDISSLSGNYYVGVKHWYKDSKINSWLLVSSNTNTNSSNMVAFNKFNDAVTKTDSNLNITMTKLWLK